MRKYFLLVTFLVMPLAAHAAPSDEEFARLKARAASITITRDDWGIAHVHGRSDADAAFSMVYAQAEDDFNRVEMNYATNLGLMARAEGEKAIWQDLRQRLFLDPDMLKADYAKSPPWLKALMDGWADGLNWYLASHPGVKPRVIPHYEPWMALSFTEGSIGGDIERVQPAALEAFYGKGQKESSLALDRAFREPSGSNGIAIAPKDTENGHALLYINPHTSFFFRAELQMTSDEGLNVYGAATWGQPFIYQGFNEHLGFMHTTSSLDAVDEFAETVTEKDGKYVYRYGGRQRPVTSKVIDIAYRTESGAMAVRHITAYFTHHGPVIAKRHGKWIAIALMNTPVKALEQSWLRTKAHDLASYQKAMALQANSSNDTVFADDTGEIALLMPQFDPVRDDRFDYTGTVDGSDPDTDWKGLHANSDAPNIINPAGGWLFNSNDGPYWGAGPDSPKQSAYPRYMDAQGQNPRTLHGLSLFTRQHGFTMETLVDAAFDSWQPAFARLVPLLVKDYDAAPDPALAGQIALLKDWDYRWSDHSMATSLAVFWGLALWDKVVPPAPRRGMAGIDAMAAASGAQRLAALREASDRLTQDFGDWHVPWGQINRYQRNDSAIVQHFDDAKPSIAVPFTSSQWGSLASFGAKRYPGTRRFYGTSGNSFVAVVEFGPKVRALAVTAGGESGDPASPHFGDQAIRYARGLLRPVYFYPEDLKGHSARVYHPGD